VVDGVHLLFRMGLFAFPLKCNKETAVKKNGNSALAIKGEGKKPVFISTKQTENQNLPCFSKRPKRRSSKRLVILQVDILPCVPPSLLTSVILWSCSWDRGAWPTQLCRQA